MGLPVTWYACPGGVLKWCLTSQAKVPQGWFDLEVKPMATHNAMTQTKNGANFKCINPNFTGPSLEVVRSSIITRDLGIPYLEEYEYLRPVVIRAKQRFCDLFYRSLNAMGTRIEEDWVTSCKKRDKELSAVLGRIIDSDETLELVVACRTATGYREFYSLDEIGYCPRSFSIVGVSEDDIVDLYINEKRPKIYGCLFVAMFKVASACREAMQRDEELFKNLCDLALSILEIAGLYNESSPDAEHWKLQELNTLKILENPPTRKDDQRIMDVFIQVCDDIRFSNKPYIKEIQNAIRSQRRYCSSPFTDKDYYYSIKADPAYIPGFKYKQSLIKSMVENDPLAGCSFDEKTGYTSAYNTTVPEGYDAPWIKTIHIANKGKYKTRAIHLAISAIQDRCCYIHNRLYAVNRRIPSDCTKDQANGQLFTCKISSPEYREDHGWSSVLAFDWSNATDKMWQWFQEECLKLVFDDEIVEFWHTVSTCKKTFVFIDGTKKVYQQINGQPQGLLGSFDAFAFAHHIIMLMTMYMSGLTEYRGSDFYRVLGDDSIISSITWDPNNHVGDNYVNICSWANMEIERSKSTEILSNNKVALVDFAKVKVLNGKYFSPIPTRLANRIGTHDSQYFAFSSALWQGSHGFFKPDWFATLIDFYYPEEEDNKLAHMLVESGIIPSFKEVGFDDPLMREEEVCLKLALCYALNKIKASCISGLLGDKTKEYLEVMDKATDVNALTTLLPESLSSVWDRVENINHKINIALESNLDKEDTIREIFSCSEDQARIMTAGLSITQEEFESIQTAIQLMDSAIDNPETIELFKSEILSLMDRLTLLDRLQYRSLYKKHALDSIILERSVRTFKEVFGTGKVQ
jgi:hypothetical protein